MNRLLALLALLSASASAAPDASRIEQLLQPSSSVVYSGDQTWPTYPAELPAARAIASKRGNIQVAALRAVSGGGSGTVTASGTPTSGQCAQWSSATNLIGVNCATLVGTPAAGDISYWTSSSAQALLTAASGGAGGYLRAGGTGVAPVWSTLTLPNAASAGQIMVAAGSNIITMSSTPTLGASGTLGSVTMGNATSGTLTIQPVTGALGATTLTAPVAVGTGRVSQVIANGTSAMGTGAISSAACATVVTTAATGTATTDVINWGFNGDPTGVTGYAASSSGMLTIMAYPSSGNVNYKVCNNTSGSITPGAITLNWIVVR